MFYEYPADTQQDKAEAQTSRIPEKPNFTDYPAHSHPQLVGQFVTAPCRQDKMSLASPWEAKEKA